MAERLTLRKLKSSRVALLGALAAFLSLSMIICKASCLFIAFVFRAPATIPPYGGGSGGGKDDSSGSYFANDAFNYYDKDKEAPPLPIIIITIIMAAAVPLVEVDIIGTEVATMKETRKGAEEM